MKPLDPITNCPDCGVKPGKEHQSGCDVERCPDCPGRTQAISCDCETYKNPRQPWAGYWPGVLECRELGLWCREVPGRGYEKCDPDHPEATEDLNALTKINMGYWSKQIK